MEKTIWQLLNDLAQRLTELEAKKKITTTAFDFLDKRITTIDERRKKMTEQISGIGRLEAMLRESNKRIADLKSRADAHLCATCKGNGVLHYRDNDNCPECDGTGTKPDALRAACVELDKFFDDKLLEYFCKKGFYGSIEIINAVKSALADEPDEVPEDLRFELSSGQCLIFEHSNTGVPIIRHKDTGCQIDSRFPLIEPKKSVPLIRAWLDRIPKGA